MVKRFELKARRDFSSKIVFEGLGVANEPVSELLVGVLLCRRVGVSVDEGFARSKNPQVLGQEHI